MGRCRSKKKKVKIIHKNHLYKYNVKGDFLYMKLIDKSYDLKERRKKLQ